MNAYVVSRVLCTLSLVAIIAGCDAADGRPESAWDLGEEEPEEVLEPGEGGGGGVPAYDCPEPESVCSGWNGTPPTVELRIFDLDDLVVAEVDGLRRGFYSIPNTPTRDTGRMDITHWFTRGSNSLRLLASNTGGPADVSIEVWIDGVLQHSATCPDTKCNETDLPSGVFFDQTFDVSSDNFPCAQQVCVYGEEEGQIYIDGVFTPNRAPGVVMLPAGRWFSISVGSGTEDPPSDAGESFVHEGRMRTETIWVPDQPMELDLSNTPVATPVEYDFLVIPVRAVAYSSGDVGVLPDDAATNLVPMIDLTSENKVMPFSYGQVKWSAEIHPTLETNATVDHRGIMTIDYPALEAAGLDKARADAADVRVWLYSNVDAHGQLVDPAPCCWWGGGGSNDIWIPTNGDFEPTITQYYLLHEWLHTLEDNLARTGWAGAGGVHGSGQHDYEWGQNGEYDFAQYYRHWMRGRVPEAGTYVGAITPLWLIGSYDSP